MRAPRLRSLATRSTSGIVTNRQDWELSDLAQAGIGSRGLSPRALLEPRGAAGGPRPLGAGTGGRSRRGHAGDGTDDRALRRHRRRRRPQRPGGGRLPGARRAARCWCSSAGTCWAAPPSPRRSSRASSSRSSPTWCRCCGPEIIRELDLPRHGLEILPLDGTFTPMPNGDYLWRMNDHARTRREIARHSRLDAEAYDEYGKAMVEMGRFVKPILGMTPPDPDLAAAWPPCRTCWRWAGASGACRPTTSTTRCSCMTMSAVDLLDQWFETDVLKATMAASGIIGTFQGVRSPGTAYVLLHHYMGEIDGAFRSWGLPRGGTGAISNAIAAPRARGGRRRSAPRRPIARILVKGGHGHAGWCWRTATRSTPRWSPPASIRGSPSCKHGRARSTCPTSSSRTSPATSSAARSGKVNLALDAPARLHLPARAGRRTCAARSPSRPASTTWSGPTTRPSTGASRAGPTSTS